MIYLLLTVALVSVAWAVSQLASVASGAQLVSTPRSALPLVAELAALTPTERFLELGSGLGHVAAFVADQGPAHAVGVDRVWLWVWLARVLHRGSPAIYQVGSVYGAVRLRSADVVYCYLLTSMLARLEPVFAQELPSGSRVISYGFPLPNRKPNRVIERTTEHGPLYLYRY